MVPQEHCPEACHGRGMCGQVAKDGSKHEGEHRCMCAFVSGCVAKLATALMMLARLSGCCIAVGLSTCCCQLYQCSLVA